MTGWSALDLPRPVFSGEFQDLEKFGVDTRVLVLNGDWWRFQAQIEDVQEKMEDAPRNPHLRQLERRLRRDQADVQKQINQLER